MAATKPFVVELYSTGGMAEYARCSPNTVIRADRQGVIRALRNSSGERQYTRADAERLRKHVQARRASGDGRSRPPPA